MTDEGRHRARSSVEVGSMILAGLTLLGLVFNSGIQYQRLNQTASSSDIASINATLVQINERLGRLETHQDHQEPAK